MSKPIHKLSARRRAQQAEASRRYRLRHPKRLQDQQAVLPVTVRYHRLLDALVLSERLSEADARDRNKVTGAVGEIVENYIESWTEIFRHR